MPFLDEIVACTAEEIAAAKKDRSIGDLRRMIRDAPPLRPFAEALGKGFGIIAEIKERSPSAGAMRKENLERAPAVYAKSPIVRAVSVLTNFSHFGMRVDRIAQIKPVVRKPVLRKDFILKEYQVYEARAFGADAILLMANLLDKDELRKLFLLASELQLDVLFEAHTKEEIESIPEGAKIYGINSRRFMASNRWWLAKLYLWLGIGRSSKAPDPSVELNTFSLVEHLPKDVIKVAESGVKPARLPEIVEMGYDSVLVGTSLLKAPEGVEEIISQFEQVLTRKSETRAASHAAVPA
jgi:indole-3-glycerol phosphate synthase